MLMLKNEQFDRLKPAKKDRPDCAGEEVELYPSLLFSSPGCLFFPWIPHCLTKIWHGMAWHPVSPFNPSHGVGVVSGYRC